jgi:hypothetical protein
MKLGGGIEVLREARELYGILTTGVALLVP